nr:endo-1,4-beta-D-glucanase [uncultured bacterium]
MVSMIGGMAAAQESGVSDERFSRLAKGINLAGWFWYAPETDDGVRNRFHDADFQLMHDLGFTFVRVPIDLDFVLDETSDNLLDAEKLALLDEGIQRLLDHDLAIIIDLHSTSLADSDASNYSGALEDPEFVDVFVEFWQAFATHLKQYDPEWVFFGPMNEPVFEADPSAWLPIQERLLTAIREVAPDHTLIATGAMWSSRETLLDMTPLADPNIIYDFHFYEPFVFTHQGATWTWDAVASMRDIPYPSSPEAVQDAVDTLRNPEAKAAVLDYGEQRWDAAKVEAEIGRVAAWADEHNVRIISTEFGTYRPYAPYADRAAWIHDTRTAYEKFGIGWAMWEYDESFSVVLQSGSRPIVDKTIAEALGLNVE